MIFWRDLYLSIPLRVLVKRLHKIERGVSFWANSSLVISILLSLWVRAPNFDLFPAFVTMLLKLVSIFTYGASVPAGSFVGTSWHHINVGYAIILGHIIITMLCFMWMNKERAATELLETVRMHRDLRRSGDVGREIAGGHAYILYLRFSIIIAALVVLSVRYFDFRADPAQGGIIAGAPEGCRAEKTWITPWANPDNKASWVWNAFSRDEWCVKGVGEVPGFKAVLPGSFFENEKERMDKLSKLNENTFIPKVKENSNFEGLLAHSPINPYEYFPYIYPSINIFSFLICKICVILIFIKIYRLRSRKST